MRTASARKPLVVPDSTNQRVAALFKSGLGGPNTSVNSDSSDETTTESQARCADLARYRIGSFFQNDISKPQTPMHRPGSAEAFQRTSQATQVFSQRSASS